MCRAQGHALRGLPHPAAEHPAVHRFHGAEGGHASGSPSAAAQGLQALRHGRHGEVPHRERRGEHPRLLAQRRRPAPGARHAPQEGNRHGGQYPQEPDGGRAEQRLQDTPCSHRPQHPAHHQRPSGQRLHQCLLHDVGR